MNIVLLTAFEPFNGYHYNVTQQIVEELNGVEIENFVVRGIVLPVSFKRARQELLSTLKEMKPRIVVGMGMAPRATKVIVELAAHNVAFSTVPDNDGYAPQGEFLEGENLVVMPTRMPLHTILHRCVKEMKLPIVFSMTVGSYLCNLAAYTIHRYLNENNGVGGFIHLPPSTDLAMRMKLDTYLPKKVLVDCVLCIVRSCIEELKQCYSPRTHSW